MSESRTSFIGLFMGLLLSVTGTGASCPIELSTPSVVVKHGDPVSVNCSALEAVDSMGWEASQAGTGAEEVQYMFWHVEQLTDWNISPKCFASILRPNNPEEQCFENLEIVVYTFPATINIRAAAVMEEGTTYNITCDIRHVAPVRKLAVKWYKDETIYHSSTFGNTARKEPVDWSPFLSFTPTRQDEGVKFRCEAHLNLGPVGPQLNVSSEEVTLSVHFGPDVQCISYVEFLEGETLQSVCPVTGNPTPFVKWTTHGSPVDPNYPIRRENAGPYTIQAEGFSSFRGTVKVVVLHGPELRCPDNDTVLENSPHNVTCIVEGYPQPEINWYKDGDEVVLPANPTRSDAGQYLITASNKLSSVNHTLDLVVIYPPSQIVELEDSLVEVGSSVWLKCASTGNPRPTYSWSYYRTDNVDEKSDDGVSRLIIHSATVDNMGFYTCQAVNMIGNVTKTVRITVKGVKPECPVKITPDRMVIPYQGKTQEVTCTHTSSDSTNVKQIYWEGVNSGTTIWQPDTQNDWDLRPSCTAEFEGRGKCQKPLNFVLYKTPDSVTFSIHRMGNSSWISWMENEVCHLQCDVINVAPVRNLAVRWYYGNMTIEPESKDSQVTGCLQRDITDCDIRTPVNVSSIISIILDRKHNNAEFRCEAQLDLGPEGPQPPHMWSPPLDINVHYKPLINYTRLPDKIPVFRGYPEDLVCEADGNPLPTIQWLSGSPHKVVNTESVLTVSEPGFYICNATNEVGSTVHMVEVILKEDYLPLIAGFVAVTVVIISIIFIFIYSIYYKNTKMRRYSLKNPKLSNQTGNVAHNGWDMQFPMTKLSEQHMYL